MRKVQRFELFWQQWMYLNFCECSAIWYLTFNFEVLGHHTHICRSTVILWFNTVSNGFILEQVHRLLVPFSKNTVLHSSDILITVTWISFSEWEIAFYIIIRVQRGSCPWGGIQYSLISKPVHLHICHSSSSRLFRHSQGENWAVTHPLLRVQEQVCQTS